MKKIILVILGMFLFGFVLNEISGSIFPIGATRLHDSTSAIFTINKNVKIAGYSESNGLKVETGEVIKTKIVKVPIATVGGYNLVNHNIADYKKILSVIITVRDDSLGYNMPFSFSQDIGLNVGIRGYTNATWCAYYPPATSVNLLNDTAFFLIKYTE